MTETIITDDPLFMETPYSQRLRLLREEGIQIGEQRGMLEGI